MRREPPRLATRLLHALCHNEALVGDLVEEYRLGRSVTWYWRQAVIAIVVGGLVHVRRLVVPLVSFAVGFLIALAFIGPIVEFTMRPLLQMPPSLAYTNPPNAGHLYTQVAALAGFVWRRRCCFIMCGCSSRPDRQDVGGGSPFDSRALAAGCS